ncbi:MAG: hypothetical protein HQL60_04040 [Magnetococcales bacterium]|nr:hypothetical protein [Magnetococcales bacterium]
MITPRYPAAPQYRRHPPKQNRRGRKLLGLAALVAILWWGFSGDSKRPPKQSDGVPAEQAAVSATTVTPVTPPAATTKNSVPKQANRKPPAKEDKLPAPPIDRMEPLVATTAVIPPPLAPPIAPPPVAEPAVAATAPPPVQLDLPRESPAKPVQAAVVQPPVVTVEKKGTPIQPAQMAAVQPTIAPEVGTSKDGTKFQIVPWAPVEGFNKSAMPAAQPDKNISGAPSGKGEKGEKLDGKKRSDGRKKNKPKPAEAKPVDPDMPEVELTFYDQLKHKQVVVPEEKIVSDKSKPKSTTPTPAAATATATGHNPELASVITSHRPSPVRMRDNNYFVPIHSYPDIRTATDIVSQWQRKGLPALVMPSPDGRTFQTGFGPFSNQERATHFINSNNKWR